jgi:GNAT superfamily N-acetyltransferase
VSASVVIGPEPFDGPTARRLVAALDADLDERYAGDTDVEGEPDYAMLNVLSTSVAPPHGVFLVARRGGVPVGCGALRPHHDGDRTAEIKRMYVVPEARGVGIARALLAALEDEAVRLGYTRAVLETGIRQQEAMAMYESSGYTLIANYGAYRDSPLSRCYEKTLVV